MNYRALRFHDEWLNLFGLPSVNFQCAISGKAGQGKSTYAIQFANDQDKNWLNDNSLKFVPIDFLHSNY